MALLQDGADLTDGALLEAFVARRDETHFEALVQRHGPMVLGVCRRVLMNVADAEDAFQATFLVLARRAASIVPRESVGSWLYGVAYRTSLAARRLAARRRARERQVQTMPHPTLSEEKENWQELLPLLDRELARLPDKYRAAVVLCQLEGRTRREAARQLGLPVGTLSGRLTTALRLLAKRLRRQGLVLSGGALAALSPQVASACVPASLIASTVKAAPLVAAGPLAAGVVSAEVVTLTRGVMQSMLLAKLKLAWGVVLALTVAAAGASVLAYRLQAAPLPQKKGEERLGGKGEDRVNDLARARVQAAEKACEAVWEAYKEGHRQEEEVYAWSVRLMDLKKEAGATRAEQRAALKKHLNRMQEMKRILPGRRKKRPPGAPVPEPPPDKALVVEFYCVEAELWLVKAKRDR
jgi:RNA polymerase sigma factor (sigma-70 family)